MENPLDHLNWINYNANLKTEQIRAIFMALSAQACNFGGLTAIMECAKELGMSDTTILSILNDFPPDQKLAALNEEDAHGRNALHYAIEKPQLLEIIFEMYPEDQRAKALEKQNLLISVAGYIRSVK